MNTLTDKKVSETLASLHEKADLDYLIRSQEIKIAEEKGIRMKHSWETAYFAINPEEGKLLYFLATASQAKKIVQFPESQYAE
jgi:predicted O-methyltransferase YrrM